MPSSTYHLKSTARWHWWHIIAMLLWGITALLIFTQIITRFIEAVDSFRTRTIPPDRAAWPLYLLGIIAIITITWQHLIVPLKSSRIATFTDHRTPKYVLRAYTLSIFMPAIIAAIILLTNLLPVIVGRFTLDLWWSMQPWLNVAVTIPFIYIILALAIYPTIRDRIRESAAREQRCMTCGYDLIGNVSAACPECGTSIDRADE